jgi:hypothetical protein
MSIIIAKKKNGQLTSLQFTLDEYSVCSFEYAPDNKAENIVVSHVSRKEQFQLLASSRYSFFGCWLHMAPFSHLSYAINKKPKNKWLFIYRDSLNTQDFSRLSQAIRKLKDTS